MSSHDTTIFWALGALLVLVMGSVFLYQRRRRSVASLEEAARVDAERKAADAKMRSDQLKAKQEFEKAVAEGRVLPDGRAPCLASTTCGAPAVYPIPRIVRDRGFWNFVRTRFGAAERYRIAEDRVAPPWYVVLLNAFGARWAWHPDRPRALCEVHNHVARQVTVAQLAHDEQDRQEADKRREVALATFEARGMLLEVQKLVKAAEEPPPPAPGERAASPRRSRRPPAPSTKSDASPMLSLRTPTNGSSSKPGVLS